MTQDRLTPRDWTDKALTLLVEKGFTALKADIVARALGVSRGSFYWHFADVEAFHTAILDRWREVAYAEIVEQLEAPARHKTPEARLRALLHRVFSASPSMERAIRAWATAAPAPHRSVTEIDAKRLAYLHRLLHETGLDAGQSATRARILYWTYLGSVIATDPLSPDAISNLTHELAHLTRL